METFLGIMIPFLGSTPVSYTHLDVYKRQLMGFEHHTEKVSGSEYHIWFYRVKKGE